MVQGKEPWMNIDETMREREAAQPAPAQEPVAQPAPQPQPQPAAQPQPTPQPAPQPQPQPNTQTEEEKPKKKSSALKIILIIIAVIFFLMVIAVIGLVVVGLLLQPTAVGSSGGISEAQSKSSWKSVAPFSIVDFSQTEGGDLAVVIKNNSGSVITLNSLKIDGKTLTTDTGESSYPNFAPNSTIVMRTSTPKECTSGNTFSYTASSIEFDYDTSDLSARIQTGKAPLTGTCS